VIFLFGVIMHEERCQAKIKILSFLSTNGLINRTLLRNSFQSLPWGLIPFNGTAE
jgi:hypothetical protein